MLGNLRVCIEANFANRIGDKPKAVTLGKGRHDFTQI